MELICKCGDDCIKSTNIISESFKSHFKPCDNCKEYKFKKYSPLKIQIELKQLDANFGKCNCGKRHLDVVMAHILKIMIVEGIKTEESTLRDVGVPLITPAYPLDEVPYLSENSLVILSKEMDKKCAEKIINEVPEVKGVLKGDLKNTVGIKDSNSTPYTYDLLGGCDLRCDIINTPWGIIFIYKYQGQMHIELPKPLSPKIIHLKKVLDKYDNPKVLDCTCGPGTLGIAALLAGANRVVFNDVWYPASYTTAMNLEINDFPTEYLGTKKGLIATGDNFEVYCMDIKDLIKVLDDSFDICLIDVFPGVDSTSFIEAVESLCLEVVII
ncbi:MAG: 50S ribosomal protein L11 methyltransferase [Methanobacterium sp.]|nr:50S ribosomal protein L11 methyltransferase [Methanobacterium sp.]